jgi:diguanylate cyclase (GGDEF)-like protein/PAS domain S-box-containing protein
MEPRQKDNVDNRSLIFNRSKILLTVLACILIYWTIDIIIDVFHDNFLINNRELLSLLSATFLFIFLGFYFRKLMTHMKIINNLLKKEVNDRQAAEQTCKNLLNQNELILNSAGEGICGLDTAGTVTFVNPAAGTSTGYAPEEFIGHNLHDLLHHTRADGTPHSRADCPVYGSLQNGDSRRVAHDLFWTKAGDSFPVEYVSTPMWRDGQVAGVVVVFRDIAARCQAENELRQAKEYLENVLDNSADPIGIVDPHGRIIKWNRASARVFGYSSGELEGKSFFDLYADKNELEVMLAQLRRDGSVHRYEIHMKKKDGSVALFALSINLLYDQKHKVVGSVCVARDRSEIKKTLEDLATVNQRLQQEVTERAQMESALQEANRSLKEMVQEFEQRNRDITLLNEMGDLLQACLTCREAYTGVAHFAALLFPEDAGALFMLQSPKKMMEAVASWGDLAPAEPVFAPEECWALRRGEIHTMHAHTPGLICPHLANAPPADSMCIPLIAQGEITGLIHLQSRTCRMDLPESLRGQLTETKQRLASPLARQISLALANLKLRDSLRAQAIRDPLTGLFNRRYMEETLEREVQRVKRRGQGLGVIMADLDFLKPINDSCGHEAGDKVIIAVGHFLQANIRREDVACRYGGDEFTLILPEASLHIAGQRAEELRAGISRLQVEYAGQPLKPVSASFGVANFPDHGVTGAEVIRAADLALYHAKQQGRNQVGLALRPAPAAAAGAPDLHREGVICKLRKARFSAGGRKPPGA